MPQHHPIKPNHKVDLSSIGTGVPKSFKLNKEDAEKYSKDLCYQLSELQELLYAENKHKLLIVLQAMDTGGKDGLIKYVFTGVNPQGVNVVRFQRPSLDELAHDYLWRIHQHVPEKGKIVIFNRSYYEDVVTVGVHNLVSEQLIAKRFGHINDFERMLTDEGVTILKYFLHISKEEQKERLDERLKDPQKNWKFNIGDMQERKLWTQYQAAYEQAIKHTSTPWASWCVVPADKNWYRNLVVTESIVETLKGLKMKYPVYKKS